MIYPSVRVELPSSGGFTLKRKGITYAYVYVG